MLDARRSEPVVLTSKCGCMFPSDGPPIHCPQHRPIYVLNGRWVCVTCGFLAKGPVLVEYADTLRCDCGRLLERSSGDELIGQD